MLALEVVPLPVTDIDKRFSTTLVLVSDRQSLFGLRVQCLRA